MGPEYLELITTRWKIGELTFSQSKVRGEPVNALSIKNVDTGTTHRSLEFRSGWIAVLAYSIPVPRYV
jgi:hypothetical protein